ncbi:MAG: hypothetical protein HQK83_19575, partial [Fibrobacteria bacterium]|nr:hypothetical protein [Fibrobacteria bacterium]
IVMYQFFDGWTKGSSFNTHPFNAARGGALTSNTQFVELADYNGEMPEMFNTSWGRQQKHQYYLEKFVAKVIETTAKHENIMYEIFNEGEWYNQSNFRRFQVHFLAFCKARTTRLLMVNDDHVSGDDFRGEDDCDIISLHKPNWDANTNVTSSFNHFSAEFGKTPVKPIYFSEPVPEYRGEPELFDANMRLMWGTAMAGAGFVVQNDASWGFTSKAAMAQVMNENLKTLKAEGNCARFFNESGIDFSGMTPKASLASTGVCLAKEGETYLVYSQSGSSFTVDLSAVDGDISARFFNPITGTFEDSFMVTGGSAAETFTKPDNDDWVLHLGEVKMPVNTEPVLSNKYTEGLKVYVNAGKNELNMFINGRVQFLGVYNMLGKELYSLNPALLQNNAVAQSSDSENTNAYLWTYADQPEGVYFVKAHTESGAFIKRIYLVR